MIPDSPPYLYICHNCGNRFTLKNKAITINTNIFIDIFNNIIGLKDFSKRKKYMYGPKCPRCKSNKTTEDWMIKK